MPHDHHHAHTPSDDHRADDAHAHEKPHAHAHGSCCSHSHADAPAVLPDLPVLPSATPAGAQTAKYRIANMDCPVEERLIRNKLSGMAGVVGLDFNLMNRVLDVHHTLPSLASVEAALHGIGMQAVPVEAGVSRPRDPDEGKLSGMQKSLLAVSGVAAVAAEALAWTTHQDNSPLVIALALLSIASGGWPTSARSPPDHRPRQPPRSTRSTGR